MSLDGAVVIPHTYGVMLIGNLKDYGWRKLYYSIITIRQNLILILLLVCVAFLSI